MQLTAKLIQILPLQSGVGKNGEWKKQEFIVETSGQFPKKVCMSTWGDRIPAPSVLQIGNELKIDFDVESREYNGRWYTDVKAWKVELASGGGEEHYNAMQEPVIDINSDRAITPEEEDDLPF